MTAPTIDGELVTHLRRTNALSDAQAAKVAEEVRAYFSEPVEAFVRRRHHQLQSAGLRNAEVFGRIQSELAGRLVPAPALTERQLRRLVYG